MSDYPRPNDNNLLYLESDQNHLWLWSGRPNSLSELLACLENSCSNCVTVNYQEFVLDPTRIISSTARFWGKWSPGPILSVGSLACRIIIPADQSLGACLPFVITWSQGDILPIQRSSWRQSPWTNSCIITAWARCFGQYPNCYI